MKKIIHFITGLFFIAGLHAQTPVPMASQPSLTYTETFTDIVNWTNNFASGVGANRFTSVAIGGATAIPSATKITTNTSIFQVPVPPATSSSTGGVHRGTDQTIPTNSIILLSTGTTENTTSAAIDFYMDLQE